ncbi:hypothetical protein AcW2_006790 [Taiwanofungus camphoratus]|nr:hypothetical protein AcW2_006790 [Antrodia cinnamomea]
MSTESISPSWSHQRSSHRKPKRPSPPHRMLPFRSSPICRPRVCLRPNCIASRTFWENEHAYASLEKVRDIMLSGYSPLLHVQIFISAYLRATRGKIVWCLHS